MIFGFVVKPEMLTFGGTFLMALMVLQVLQGMRKIRLKGSLHLKVHKWGAWALLAAAALHGFLGYVYALQLTLG